MRRSAFLIAASFLVFACQSGSQSEATAATSDKPFDTAVIADFDEPWAMTFVSGTPYALITEKKGKLLLWQADGPVREIKGVPQVAYGGQGGFGDVIMHGHEDANGEFEIALSWVEQGAGGYGAAVALAKVDLSADAPQLRDIRTIWKQSPKVDGRGHFGHRLAFSSDGKYLFISSGERQKFNPAQDMNANLGKIVRLNADGSTPTDNPFYDAAKPVQSQIWSLGHRNPLGIAFDAQGRLWNQEMGPAGGDELNLVKKATNYGYPKVSNGDHYDGKDIPDHKPGDGFEAPKVFWNPSISPGGLMIYSGDLFKDWKGSAFLGGLGSTSLVRVKLDGENATKADQWNMNARIREVEQGPDGAIWLLEDGDSGSQGRLLKLTPKK